MSCTVCVLSKEFGGNLKQMAVTWLGKGAGEKKSGKSLVFCQTPLGPPLPPPPPVRQKTKLFLDFFSAPFPYQVARFFLEGMGSYQYLDLEEEKNRQCSTVRNSKSLVWSGKHSRPQMEKFGR